MSESERLDDERGPSDNLTKRLLTMGLGAYFLTEDTVRRYVKDAKIPRDIARSITSNAARGKDELYSFIARELGDFLNKMDVQEELQRFVRDHKIRVSAEIEFLAKDPSAEASSDPAKPDVEFDLRYGSSKPEPEDPPADDA